jgi:hypothetical protein
VKPGEWYRVKATPLLRRYGVSVSGATDRADSAAWTLEVGTVELRTWTAHNGDTMSALRLTFSRGRSVMIPRVPEDDTGYWLEALREFKTQFVKVKPMADSDRIV